MRRSLLGAAVGCLLPLLVPAIAGAKIIEVGKTATPVTAPVCPPNVSAANCTIILPWVTAFETQRDGIRGVTKVTQNGRIVAFTVGLSALTSNRTLRRQYIHDLDSSYGGTARVAITVLRLGRRNLNYQVVAESPFIHVQPFLGEVVQFPLETSLPVQAGDIVALTTSTWAPVLSIDVPANANAYRQSRDYNCSNPPASASWQRVGEWAYYYCQYYGTRVEYSATEVTTPVPPSNYVHAGDPGVGAQAGPARFSGGVGF